ncbi:MAG: ATP cone domain-containing protein, partial [Pseudomonadota bacterium]
MPDTRYAHYKVIRRNGAVVAFEPIKISVAMTKAFIAVDGGQGAASVRVREIVAGLTTDVVNALLRRQPDSGTFHIENIQDQVELALMRSGEHDVARAYVLYREERTKERARLKQKPVTDTPENSLYVLDNGQKVLLDTTK